jgi:hypothetical protein
MEVLVIGDAFPHHNIVAVIGGRGIILDHSTTVMVEEQKPQLRVEDIAIKMAESCLIEIPKLKQKADKNGIYKSKCNYLSSRPLQNTSVRKAQRHI